MECWDGLTLPPPNSRSSPSAKLSPHAQLRAQVDRALYPAMPLVPALVAGLLSATLRCA